MPYADPYAELHCHSGFGFLRAGSSVEALIARAAELGMKSLALTDYMTLAGVVRFQVACQERGIHAIVGAELAVAEPKFGAGAAPAQLVVLAQNATGYARLCYLLTEANLADPDAPLIPFAALAAQPDGLIFLTGGREGTLTRLLLAGRRQDAEAIAHRYREAFGPQRVYVEIQHHALPDSIALMRELARVAETAGLRVVATNGVRYATRGDYLVYDLLTCVRLGITVDQPHAERPRNDEVYLKSAEEMAALVGNLPWGVNALAATEQIATQCHVSLLKSICTAPAAPLPAGETPTQHLHRLCEEGLATRYAGVPEALAAGSPQRQQLAHEVAIIEHLELQEFFLCVADIMRQARAMGIRVSGRGSAANSIVAYLLDITGVDPLRHRLLFERFLNPDRAGMPDIDVDVQSDRREEVIRYVERTYTHAHAAMVANVITYRARSALRDTLKALGFPLSFVNQLTKVLHHHASRQDIARAHDELTQVVQRIAPPDLRTRCLARLPLALKLASRLVGLPRHLSLHNGGMVLSREPLASILPVRVSANGVRALEIDKDDTERVGLIKFDLLGLRTLGAIQEALALIEETTNERPNVDHLPTDPPDDATMRLVRAGQTLAVFQIESPGQWHLLAQTQPTSFDDLIVQTALFRPGPLQGGFVRPYVESRMARQADAVQTPWQGTPDSFWTDHPVLGPLLRDTEGILLFQEQILELAHRYAGLSYAEADGFRRAISHARSPQEMEAMRAQFLAGATARGESLTDATRVFEAISAYLGYGFCRSHAAEFARTIYITAWLKAHYPAHYLAAFLSSQPAGFFPPHVIVEEAKLLGIPVLAPHVNYSLDRFSVEQVGSPGPKGHRRWAIRIGLCQVTHVGEEVARAILWERQGGQAPSAAGIRGMPSEASRRRTDGEGHARPFTSLSDFLQRMRPARLTWSAAKALVLSGACDGLRPGGTRRQLLWHLHELWPLVSPARTPPRGMRRKRRPTDETRPLPEQLVIDWDVGSLVPGVPAVVAHAPPLPALPALDREERSALDYALLGMSACPHPLHARRRELRRRGVYAVAELAEVAAERVVRVAGWCISAQRPPTAHGMGFIVIEDETGRLPVALPPRLAARMHRVLRDARIVVVTGRVERVRWYRSVFAFDLFDLS